MRILVSATLAVAMAVATVASGLPPVEAAAPATLELQREIVLTDVSGVPRTAPRLEPLVAPDGSVFFWGRACYDCSHGGTNLLIRFAPGGAHVSTTALPAPPSEHWSWVLAEDGRSFVVLRQTLGGAAFLDKRRLDGSLLGSASLGSHESVQIGWSFNQHDTEIGSEIVVYINDDARRVRRYEVTGSRPLLVAEFEMPIPPDERLMQAPLAQRGDAGTWVMVTLVARSDNAQRRRVIWLVDDRGAVLSEASVPILSSGGVGLPSLVALPNGELVSTHVFSGGSVVQVQRADGSTRIAHHLPEERNLNLIGPSSTGVWLQGLDTLDGLTHVDLTDGWRVTWSDPDVRVRSVREAPGGALVGAGTHSVGEYVRYVPSGQERVGYWMATESGRVFGFGAAQHHGDLAPPEGDRLVAFVGLRGGSGYRAVTAGGRVLEAGAAAGAVAGTSPNLSSGEHITSLAHTPSEAGYWLFSNLGRTFAYGDASHFGDLAGVQLNGPIVGSGVTASGGGYYMVGSDGGLFTFGDAIFRGSLPQFAFTLNEPVVGVVGTPSGDGYWMVAADGGAFAFGDASYVGSVPAVLAPGVRLAAPVNGLVPSGSGYLMVASDGGVFDFSGRGFQGSLGATAVDSPVIAVAPLVG